MRDFKLEPPTCAVPGFLIHRNWKMTHVCYCKPLGFGGSLWCNNTSLIHHLNYHFKKAANLIVFTLILSFHTQGKANSELWFSAAKNELFWVIGAHVFLWESCCKKWENLRKSPIHITTEDVAGHYSHSKGMIEDQERLLWDENCYFRLQNEIDAVIGDCSNQIREDQTEKFSHAQSVKGTKIHV